MNQKRKNIILVLVALVVTNLITHYASSGQDSRLGKKTTVVIASVDGKEFTSNDIYNSWKSDGQSSTTINSLINSVDSYILNDKYEDSEEIAEELDTQVKQAKAYYEDQGQDFDELLSQSGMTEDSWEEMLKLQIQTQKETQSYVESIVTKDQVQEAYDADEVKVRTSQILFKVEVSEDTAVADVEAEAKAKADDVYKLLTEEMENSEDKQATFAKYAKEYSEDVDSKENGGDVGFSNSEDSAYQEAIKDLEIDEYTEVVKTSYGYAIIMKTDVQEKKSLDDEAVYEKYQTQVAEQMIEENSSYSQLALIELRSSYGLKFKDTDLGEQYSTIVEQTNAQFETTETE
ncbi:MAG: peptidylprolyl isomerase [Bacilli bacterium]